MDYDDIYPEAKENKHQDVNLYKGDKEEECKVCKEIYTKWRYVLIKRNGWGYPTVTKTPICSEECFEYYDIMKGLL